MRDPEQASSDERFAGRDWHVETHFADTGLAGFQRVEIDVFAADARRDSSPAAHLTGFVGTRL